MENLKFGNCPAAVVLGSTFFFLAATFLESADGRQSIIHFSRISSLKVKNVGVSLQRDASFHQRN